MEIKLVDRKKAAKIAGVCRQTIQAWIKSGKLNIYFSGFRSKKKQNIKGWVSPIELQRIVEKRKK